TRGELVGINTAIASETGNYAGYSFAVPISIASKIVTDLKQYGSVQRAVLGVSIADINSELQKEKKLNTLDGVYVAEVVERGSAAESGIKPDDVILSINDVPTKSVSELQEQVSRYRPGDKVKVNILRGNDKKAISVTLKNQQGNTEVTKEMGLSELGATFQPVSNAVKQQLGIRSGLQVNDVKGGKFAQAGIRKGFIVLQVNNRKVTSTSDLDQIIKEIRQSGVNEQGMFIMGVYPNGKTAYYAINLAE
ncbi:MAG: PDZ domain-containing protein, partial [Bacteroidales bacterium]